LVAVAIDISYTLQFGRAADISNSKPHPLGISSTRCRPI